VCHSPLGLRAIHKKKGPAKKVVKAAPVLDGNPLKFTCWILPCGEYTRNIQNAGQ